MNNFNEQITSEKSSEIMQSGNGNGNGNGFFILNLFMIIQIAQSGGEFEEVAAYLVLTRGSGRNRIFSTHGANSISKRTGMSNYRAEQALIWLINNGFILKVETDKNKPKARQSRYQLIEFPNAQVIDVPLANSLIDGIGSGKNNPPITRINNEVKLGDDCNIAYSRLDAVMLLLFLYRHHEIADFGGVNPKAGLYREYFSAQNSNGIEIENIEGTQAALFEIEGSDETLCGSIAIEALFYIVDVSQMRQRFYSAFLNLKRLGFLYEVISIWNENPVNNIKAYPFYTLYIHDHHARVNEPYLSTEIHNLAIRRKTLDSYEEFSNVGDIGSANIIKTGRFRFVAHQLTGGYPIGIFRLRFRPWTRDCGRGIAEEQNRVDRWSAILNKL